MRKAPAPWSISLTKIAVKCVMSKYVDIDMGFLYIKQPIRSISTERCSSIKKKHSWDVALIFAADLQCSAVQLHCKKRSEKKGERLNLLHGKLVKPRPLNWHCNYFLIPLCNLVAVLLV